MDVIEDARQRLLRRQVGRQPIDPVEDGEPSGAPVAGRREIWRKYPLGGSRRPIQQPVALRGLGGGEDRLEQSVHDPERKLMLELGTASAQDAQAG